MSKYVTNDNSGRPTGLDGTSVTSLNQSLGIEWPGGSTTTSGPTTTTTLGPTTTSTTSTSTTTTSTSTTTTTAVPTTTTFFEVCCFYCICEDADYGVLYDKACNTYGGVECPQYTGDCTYDRDTVYGAFECQTHCMVDNPTCEQGCDEFTIEPTSYFYNSDDCVGP